MTGRTDSLAMLDRLIRVRTVKARQALAELGRAQARQTAEIQLQARVATLIAEGEADVGTAAANALSARGQSNVLLGALAADSAERLAAGDRQRAALAAALARARAAVDAAISRRAEREKDPC